MAITINTQSAKYQSYMIVLNTLKADMAPRLKMFVQLSEQKQKWWLQRDPLMRRLIKLSILVQKSMPVSVEREVEND